MEKHKELEPVKKSLASWLKTAGFVAGGVATVIFATTTTLVAVPVAIIIMSKLAKDVAIPGTELIVDWVQGKKQVTGNGLHYYIKLKG